MSWEPRHDRLYKDGVLIRHRIQRTPDGEWEDYVEEKVELPKQSMRMKAFPTLKDNGHITTQDGMDLRDYFAAKAMQVYMAERSFQEIDENGEMQIYENGVISWEPDEVAVFAYEMADAMMEARKHD